MAVVPNPAARREAYIKHHGHDPVSDAAIDTWWRVRQQSVSSYDNASFADTGAIPAWEVQTPYEAAVDEAVDNLQHDDQVAFASTYEQGNDGIVLKNGEPAVIEHGPEQLHQPAKPVRQARKPKPAPIITTAS